MFIESQWVCTTCIVTDNDTDSSFLVLHPSYKLRYFEKAGWTAEWVKEAVRILREDFTEHYAAYAVLQQVRFCHSITSSTLTCV